MPPGHPWEIGGDDPTVCGREGAGAGMVQVKDAVARRTVRAAFRPARVAVTTATVLLTIVVVLVVLALLGPWLVSHGLGALNPFGTERVDRSGPVVVKSLKDLKTFEAAGGYYEVVVDQEKDVKNLPSFIAGERVIFVAAGTVKATVDFSGIGADAVVADQSRRTITVKLPAPRLATPELDLEHSYVADHQRGLTERVQDALGQGTSGDDLTQIYALAQQRLADAAARTPELRDRAEASTRAMLTALLTQAGYTTVTVVFVDEG